MIKEINGGVTVPKGFAAVGIAAGIKKGKKDMAMIYSEAPCQVAVAPRITCRFGTWGSCGRRRRSSGYQPSSGFGALPGSLFPVCVAACPVEWRFLVHF